MSKEVTAVLALLAVVSSAIGGAFAIFLFLDSRHAHDDEVHRVIADMTSEVVRRDRMSESTRLAQVVKWYTDRLNAGEELSQADKDRLDLAQREQQRIHAILVDTGDSK
jgi:hypothetical protein